MIGVFDSGLGGLSVLAAIARLLPRADLVYLADTAYLPYGSKHDEFIRRRVLAIGRYLVAQGCRIVVVACNTATAAAVQALRAELHGIPVVGIEPGVKPAAQSSRSRRIAVLTTESTARSARLAHLIRDHGQGVHVHVQPCPGWATRVETFQFDSVEFVAELRATIAPLLADDIDRLILGCTHYSFLVPLLQPIVDGRAELVDVAMSVAQQVMRLRDNTSGQAKLALLATAHPERLHVALHRFSLTQLANRASAATLCASLLDCDLAENRSPAKE